MGVAGYALAIEGLYLRRSGVTDEEALAFLLLPLFVLAVHRALTASQHRTPWTVLSIGFFLIFPLLHTFSSLIAGIAITGIAGFAVARDLTYRRALGALTVVGSFWLYVGGYYHFATKTVLTVPYVDRVTAYPGLFVAWLILLLAGGVWLQRTSTRLQRLVLLLPLGGWFALLVVNSVRSVFPGMQTTPPLLLGFVALYLIPVLLFVVGFPLTTRTLDGITPVIVALILAPLVVVFFSLTASLTPEYFDTAIRGHTFIHTGIFICVGLAVGHLAARQGSNPAASADHKSADQKKRYVSARNSSSPSRMRRGLAVGLAILVLITALGTMPLAFVHLDTMAYPKVTTQSMFEAAEFASTHATEPWATDDPLTRVSSHSHAEANVSTGSIIRWLNGGAAPTCPALIQQSWATSGAHLFPAPAATLNETDLKMFSAQRNVVYSVDGSKQIRLIGPQTRAGSC
jgi:hypothetical protein